VTNDGLATAMFSRANRRFTRESVLSRRIQGLSTGAGSECKVPERCNGMLHFVPRSWHIVPVEQTEPRPRRQDPAAFNSLTWLASIEAGRLVSGLQQPALFQLVTRQPIANGRDQR
jgi:hypothetical protein